MSEPLTRELRGRLLTALAAVPATDTPQGRATLLANLPPKLQNQIACDGPKAIAISTMLQVLERVDELDSGESALCIVIEAALDTVKGAELSRELEDILNTLGGGASRLAALRAAYADHLRAKYAPANLRGLIPAEYARLHRTTVLLRDIYIPLTATVTEHSLNRREVYLLRTHREADGKEWTGLDLLEGVKREGDQQPQHDPPRRERVPVTTLVAEQPVVILLGDPGSGKSAFLKQYALDLLDQAEGPLPIMVPLAAYAQALQERAALSIEDFAAQHYAAEGLLGLKPLFTAARRAGQAVYLLDGLDEVPGDWRGAIGDRVAALALDMGADNRLVATSRITGYIPLMLAPSSEATLEPFVLEQIEEFVQKWYTIFFEYRGQAGQAEKTAEGLLRTIRENPSVGRLAGNPLTLTMLALLYFAGSADLPRQRVKLYGQVARTLIEDWRKARSLAGMPVGSAHEELEVLKRVGPLAYWLHDQKPEGLATRAEIEYLLARIEREAHPDEDPLPGVRRFLDQLRGEVGLLSEKGMDQWGFTHLTFEEYFAAREIARWRQSRVEAEVARRAPDPRWTEVIRLAMAYIGTESGRTEDATALVEETILGHADPYEPYLHRNLLLAGRVITDDPGIEPRIGELVARALFDLYRTTEIRILQVKAGEVLREILASKSRTVLLDWLNQLIEERRLVERLDVFAGDADICTSLLPLLDDPDALVREAAVEALSRADLSDSVVRTALLPLLSDPVPAVRQATIMVLGTTRDPALREQFLRLLADPAPIVQLAAVTVLNLYRGEDDPAIFDTMLSLLANEDSTVRANTVLQIGQSVYDYIMYGTLLYMTEDPSPMVRQSVVYLLQNVLVDHSVVTALQYLLDDPDRQVRVAAGFAVGAHPSAPSTQQDVPAILNDPHKLAQPAIIETLGPFVSDPSVQKILISLLNDTDSALREAAITALTPAARSFTAVTSVLLSLLDDREAHIRREAVVALGTIVADPVVRDALLPLLTDPELDVRRAAAEALANATPAPAIREQLGVMLADPLTATSAFAALARWAEVEDGTKHTDSGRAKK